MSCDGYIEVNVDDNINSKLVAKTNQDWTESMKK